MYVVGVAGPLVELVAEVGPLLLTEREEAVRGPRLGLEHHDGQDLWSDSQVSYSAVISADSGPIKDE